MMTSGPETYAQARASFLAAAHENSYEIVSFELANHTGALGEPLFCDMAIRRSPHSGAALVTTSAVHGVEGMAGSALQRAWMNDDRDRKISLVHVHALNPFGYSWDRRADHENIDVCRNFVQFENLTALNPGYQKYADAIVPVSGGRLRNELKILALQISPGAAAMKDIITKGQYTHPKGMYYGGAKPSWSRDTWHNIISTHLAGFERIIHLDIHTGLGAFGELQVIGKSAEQKEAPLAYQAWGAQLAFMNHQGGNTSLSSPITGDIENAWSLHRHGAESAASFTFEFGTRPTLQVFRALQAEHAAYARAGDVTGIEPDVRARMRQAFAPAEAGWIEAVQRNGGRAYEAVANLLEHGRNAPSA